MIEKSAAVFFKSNFSTDGWMFNKVDNNEVIKKTTMKWGQKMLFCLRLQIENQEYLSTRLISFFLKKVPEKPKFSWRLSTASASLFKYLGLSAAKIDKNWEYFLICVADQSHH